MKDLNIKDKTLLFSELLQLEMSGIIRFKALSLIGEHSSEIATRANETLRLCKLNISFPEAGFKSGLFDKSEKSLIQMADKTAQYEMIYQYLKNTYQERLSAQKKLKAQLFLPAAVFILSLFIAPIPELFEKTITLSEYLFDIIFTLIKLFATVYLLLKLPYWIKNNVLGSSFKRVFYSLLLNIPIFNKVYIQKVMLEYFHVLALSLKAGLPAIESLKFGNGCVNNIIIKEKLSLLPTYIEQGDSFTGAMTRTLKTIKLIDPAIYQAIRTGEMSGSLDESIKKMVHFLNEFNQQTINTFYEWLPRVIYLMVLGLISYGLIE